MLLELPTLLQLFHPRKKKGIHLVEGGRREIEKKWDGSHTFYTLL